MLRTIFVRMNVSNSLFWHRSKWNKWKNINCQRQSPESERPTKTYSYHQRNSQIQLCPFKTFNLLFSLQVAKYFWQHIHQEDQTQFLYFNCTVSNQICGQKSSKELARFADMLLFSRPQTQKGFIVNNLKAFSTMWWDPNKLLEHVHILTELKKNFFFAHSPIICQTSLVIWMV